MGKNSGSNRHGSGKDGKKKSHAPSPSSSRGQDRPERQTPASTQQHRGGGHNAFPAEGYSDHQSRWSNTAEAGSYEPSASYDDLAAQDRAREQRRAYAINHPGMSISMVQPYTPPTSLVNSINVNELFPDHGYHASPTFGYSADLELDDEGQSNSAYGSSGYSQHYGGYPK